MSVPVLPDLRQEVHDAARRARVASRSLTALSTAAKNSALNAAADALLAHADGLLDTIRAHYDVPAMHLALEAIWLMLGAANRYFSAEEPWVLRKSPAESDQTRFGTVLYTTLEAVRIAALLVQPVMPTSGEKLLDLLGQDDSARDFSAVGTRLVPGTALPTPEGVFPRYQAVPKE